MDEKRNYGMMMSVLQTFIWHKTTLLCLIYIYIDVTEPSYTFVRIVYIDCFCSL